MKKSKKTTIYDIAAEAGSTASTVASVLNGTWQKRRIKQSTAEAIQKIAVMRAYSPNLQARGLRMSRSGLVGMIIPFLDFRFFSSLAEAFDVATRAEHLFPVVVSTHRDPAKEQDTVRALISHNVESLFLAGATDPDSLSEICRTARVKHINVDLLGSKAPSVTSDNFHGAVNLTQAIVERIRLLNPTAGKPSIYFIGGVATDHNTQQRMGGFRSCLNDAGWALEPSWLQPSGYEATLGEAAIRRIYLQHGSLPDGLFVNSTMAFEGVARFLSTLPLEKVRACSIGCFDWDPYIEFLPFPVIMVRQNVHAMISEAYSVLKRSRVRASSVILVPTELIRAKTLQDEEIRDSRLIAPSAKLSGFEQEDALSHADEQRAGTEVAARTQPSAARAGGLNRRRVSSDTGV